MAVLCVGDFLFKYLRINRPGSYVRFSSGARVEQLPGGMPDIKEFQVSGLIYLFIYQTVKAILTFKMKRSIRVSDENQSGI